MAKKHITLLAKSSSGYFYNVEVYFEENNILAYCSCQAGENGMLCKHVKGIINGDDTILYDTKQKKELEQICNHLPETAIPLLVSEIKNTEDLLEEAKRNAKKAKKNLEKVLLGKIHKS
ncbi:MAG: hypothetical protein GXY41_10790 [Phycisphaerae bacterium]|nr:hypothetical protein [Phycisphaerae bacterium]